MRTFISIGHNTSVVFGHPTGVLNSFSRVALFSRIGLVIRFNVLPMQWFRIRRYCMNTRRNQSMSAHRPQQLYTLSWTVVITLFRVIKLRGLSAVAFALFRAHIGWHILISVQRRWRSDVSFISGITQASMQTNLIFQRVCVRDCNSVLRYFNIMFCRLALVNYYHNPSICMSCVQSGSRTLYSINN